MELKSVAFYKFASFHLEPAEHRLTREGQQVSLAPKTFELLVYLVENHGRLVSKEQIMQALWPASFVEEANLTVTISALRKVLSRNESGLQYIETIPKKGYRFTAQVVAVRGPEVIRTQPEEKFPKALPFLRPEPEPASSTSPVLELFDEDRRNARGGLSLVPPRTILPKGWKRRTVLPGTLLLACVLAIAGYFLYSRGATPVHPLHAQRSLAILPLRNLRQDPNSDFLGFSLADAVITKLSSLSSLAVQPSSAVEKYKGRTVDLPRVAAELKVNTVLTGSFIRDADDLRITYQLIDVETGKILGRDTIELKYDKLLTVHDNVAQQIIKGLALNLSSSESERTAPDEPLNPLAYEYYLRGVDLMGGHNFPLAIKMLEKSAAVDPNHALTWAYLGQSYNSSASFEMGGRELYQKAQTAYEHALRLQPRQMEATMFLSNLLIDTGKVEQAVPILRNALKIDTKHAATHWELGYAYRFAGMLKESTQECELARQIDPLVKSNGSVLNAYLYLGQYGKFLNSLPDVRDSSFFLFYRGFAEYHQNDWIRAARDFDHAYELEGTLYTQIGKAISDSIQHRDSDGLEILHTLEDKIRQRAVGDPEAAYKIAQGYAVLADKASAIQMLKYSIQNGFFSYPYFLRDPLLDSLRGRPEFSGLMQAAHQRYEAFKIRFF